MNKSRAVVVGLVVVLLGGMGVVVAAAGAGSVDPGRTATAVAQAPTVAQYGYGPYGYYGYYEYQVDDGVGGSAPSISLDRTQFVCDGEGSVTVFGAGWTPGTEARITMYSTPVLLGTVSVDASGSFEAVVRVPKLEPGTHTIEVTDPAGHKASLTCRCLPGANTTSGPAGTSGGTTGGTTGGSGGLARTGANALWIALLGAVLVAAGVATRRRATRTTKG